MKNLKHLVLFSLLSAGVCVSCNKEEDMIASETANEIVNDETLLCGELEEKEQEWKNNSNLLWQSR